MTLRFLFPLNLLSLMLILGLAIAQSAQPNELPAIKSFPTAEGVGHRWPTTTSLTCFDGYGAFDAQNSEGIPALCTQYVPPFMQTPDKRFRFLFPFIITELHKICLEVWSYCIQQNVQRIWRFPLLQMNHCLIQCPVEVTFPT